MKLYPLLYALVIIAITTACEESDGDDDSECGEHKTEYFHHHPEDYFTQPSEIYWAVVDSTRYYTYNWTLSNICTKENPKVKLSAGLFLNNSTMSNPFSFDAGVQTCFGVQAQTVILAPDAEQDHYENVTAAEIGMNQCFGGDSSATIYPFVTISFTTLGSHSADSAYLAYNVVLMSATMEYSVPK